ncbi:SPRY domain-containing SOCS box protein 3-like isoform 2-T2 [Discoglossus pictus]
MPVGFVESSWVWDVKGQSPAVDLSPCQRAVYFHTDPVLGSTGTAGVRGNTGFLQGEHYWEIEFLEPPSGLSVMVGVGTARAILHAGSYRYIDLLGMDGDSWGLSYKGTVRHGGHSQRYTDPFYKQGTVIGVHLNLEDGTLRFYRDRQSLGVAFTGLNKAQSPLYPMVSSTAPGTELALGMRCSSFPSLQERCIHTLAHSLAWTDLAELLPLPVAIRWKLKSWKEDQDQSVLWDE